MGEMSRWSIATVGTLVIFICLDDKGSPVFAILAQVNLADIPSHDRIYLRAPTDRTA